jgi:hypothetical protein
VSVEAPSSRKQSRRGFRESRQKRCSRDPVGTRRAERRVEVVLEQAVARRGVVGDVGLLGAGGAVRMHGVDGEGVRGGASRSKRDRGAVPRDRRPAHVGGLNQTARGQIHGGVGAGYERARSDRGREKMQARAAGEDVEVLWPVGRRRRRAAHVDDLGERRQGTRGALAPVPLADDAVRGNRVDGIGVVVVSSLVAEGSVVGAARRRAAIGVRIAEVFEERPAAMGNPVGPERQRSGR